MRRGESTAHRAAGPAAPSRFPDDRHTLEPGDNVVLIVEDDPRFARAHDRPASKGFKVLVATRGTEALALARAASATAISLDIFLPDMLGWTVLGQLKRDPRTRHIPCRSSPWTRTGTTGSRAAPSPSYTEATRPQGLEDAFARIKGYAAPRRKRLLIVEDDEVER